MGISVTVKVDWDLNGDFTGTYDDITAYVRDVSAAGGLYGYIDQRVADVGYATIQVDNTSRLFSPKYASGALYGKLLPNRPVIVQASDGVTTHTLFKGTIQRIAPEPGTEEAGTAYLYCEDQMAPLRDFGLAIPYQEDTSGQALIRKITAEAFRKDPATGIVYLVSNTSNNDTLTIGSTTYTFKTTLTGAANEVLIGTSRHNTVDNLVRAINADEGAGTLYGTGTVRHAQVGATVRYDSHAADGYTAQLPIGDVSTNEIWQAQQFTPNVAGYVSYLSFYLGDSFGSPTTDIAWEIRNDSSDLPGGTIIVSGTVTPTANTNMIVTAPGAHTALSASTPYWLVLHTPAAQPDNTGYYVRSHNPSIYSGGGHAQSTDGGSSWTGYDYDLSFSVLVGGVVDVTAQSRGAWGNDIAFTEGSSTIALSGAGTLTGGADLDAADLETDTGVVTIENAADQWSPDLISALDAARDVTRSEFGFLWARQDGKIVWHNRNYQFTQVTATAALTLNNTYDDLRTDISTQNIINRVQIGYTPRATLSAGVVARAENTIEVPVTTYDPRWTTTQDLPVDGNYTLRLPFVDPATGRAVGAKDLINPVPGTDFNVYESIGGRDYTALGWITVSTAPTGSGVEVTFVNNGGTPFYVTDFQVRGTGITAYDTQESLLDDATSQAAYGRRAFSYDLPLPIASAATAARALGEYFLGRYANPLLLARSITFRAPNDSFGGTNVFSLLYGSTLVLTESQTGITSERYMVIGSSYQIAPAETDEGDDFVATFYLFPLGDVTYGILDDATYGLLDSTARLAI